MCFLVYTHADGAITPFWNNNNNDNDNQSVENLFSGRVTWPRWRSEGKRTSEGKKCKKNERQHPKIEIGYVTEPRKCTKAPSNPN